LCRLVFNIESEFPLLQLVSAGPSCTSKNSLAWSSSYPQEVAVGSNKIPSSPFFLKTKQIQFPQPLYMLPHPPNLLGRCLLNSKQYVNNFLALRNRNLDTVI